MAGSCSELVKDSGSHPANTNVKQDLHRGRPLGSDPRSELEVRRLLIVRQFHHVGIPTDEEQPGEVYVEDTRVWVTDPMEHPYRVEFLRFEPDSPVTGPLRELPHLAFKTDDVQREIVGKQIILEPFEPMEGLTVAFILEDGAVFEYMQWASPTT